MTNSSFDDLVVKAQAVGTVEDDVLAEAQTRAAEAEKDDFNQTVATIDEQLKRLRAEERILVRRDNGRVTSTKLQAIRKRIDATVARRQSLYDANDERRRIALSNQASSATAISDDMPAEGESQRDFLIRTGKLTPFQGQQGYERASSTATYQNTEPSRRRLISRSDAAVAINVDDNHEDQIFEHEHDKNKPTDAPQQLQTSEKKSRKRPRPPPKDDEKDDPGNESDEEYLPSSPGAFSDDEDDKTLKKPSSSWSQGNHNRSRKKKQKNTQDEEFLDASDEESIPEGDDVDISAEEEVEFDGGLRIPATVFDKLFAYQRTGVQWLWELHSQGTGGILGDEMGLGKTVQIAAFLAALNYSEQLKGSAIILAPTTVLRQWHRELRSWWPRFRVRILHHSEETVKQSGKSKVKRRLEGKFNPKAIVEEVISKDHGILITSYEQVRKNPDLFLENFEYVIADEGHKLKSPDTEITLTCKRFDTPHRIILSGSPLQNHLKELWSLFDFVFPGKLGTLPVFHAEFVLPITTGGYSTATKVQVHTAYKCSLTLRDIVSPYLLRRFKKDVAKQLPEKNEEILFVKLTPEQREKYQTFIKSRFVRQVLNGRLNLLYAVTALRKICNHCDIPIHKNDNDRDMYGSAYTKAMGLSKGMEFVGSLPTIPGIEDYGADMEDYGNYRRSGKMIVLDRVLETWKKSNGRALVFSQTTTMLDILERFVKEKNYKYQRMDGTTAVGSRMELIDKFNHDDSIFIFLLTTRVGGLGVNLTGADKVVLYDPDWNPSTDLQARERSWRIGQTRPVTIYRLITSGTIEEKIFHRQIYKQFLSNKVLSDPRQRRFFKPKDIRDLFSLGNENEHTTETGDIFSGTGVKEVKPNEVSSSKDKSEAGNTADQKSKDSGNASVLNSLLDVPDGQGVIQSMMNHDEILGAGTAEQDASLVEYEAGCVAENALEEVRKSSQARRQQSVAVPTWTGRSGLAGIIGSGRNTNGFDFGTSGSGGSKGNSLLQKIKAREGKTVTLNNGGNAEGDNEAGPSRSNPDNDKLLMEDLIDFFKQNDGQSTSEEIVSKFGGRVERRADGTQVFHAMIKKVAILKKGAGPGGKSIWKLREDAATAL